VKASTAFTVVRSTTESEIADALPAPDASRARSAIQRIVSEALARNVTVAVLVVPSVAALLELICAAPTNVISVDARFEPCVARMTYEAVLALAEPYHEPVAVVDSLSTTEPPTDAEVSRAEDE
jgi:hypothetical protein